MLEHAIETGRGGVYLRLTPEQYAKLCCVNETLAVTFSAPIPLASAKKLIFLMLFDLIDLALG